jgi:GNAT superfamily N-acetyltransferase
MCPPTSADVPEIVELRPDETHELRRTVLRADTPTKEVVFDEDTWPGAVHLGLRLGGAIVATSTWVPRPHEGRPAVQLRGMATATELQGTGLGGVLLRAGCDRAVQQGYELVWARARDAALTFYLRHGFQVSGDGFVDEATQLPHHLVLRVL